MKGKRHRPDEVVRLVREAETAIGQGTPVAEVARGLGVSEMTLIRWRQRYGGLSTPEAKRLKGIEKEVVRLKDIIVELELDKRILQEALRGKT
jgi:transposase-like protein